MGSKSPLVILIIGILGLASLGMMTKYVFETNAGLQEVTRFKVAFIADFSARGIDSVSVRKLRRERAVELRMVAPPERIPIDHPVHREIAEYYLDKHPRSTETLKLRYLRPARWGCSSSTPFLEKSFSLSEIAADLRARERRTRLDASLAELGVEAVDIEEARELLHVRVTRRPDGDGTAQEAPRLLRGVAKAVVRAFRPARKFRIRVEFLAPPPAGGATPAANDPPADTRTGTDPVAGAGTPKEGPPADAEAKTPSGDPQVVASGVFDFRGRPVAYER